MQEYSRVSVFDVFGDPEWYGVTLYDVALFVALGDPFVHGP